MQTFSKGARGFLVRTLQEGLERGIGRRLPLGCDGRYGKEVMDGVVELTKAQPEAVQYAMRQERALFGEAGPAVWRVLGLEWPELFARCLGLTSEFEGTGFSGAVGPAQVGDTAGVTYGIIGFTSYNGELQKLLQAASVDQPDQFEYVGAGVLGVGPFFQMMNVLEDGDKRAFERWALSKGGSVRPSVKDWLKALGELPWMRKLQMQSAYSRYWTNIAVKQARVLFVKPSDRAHALMFDIAVQNGGLKQLEVSDLAIQFGKDPALTETERMHAVHTMLIERLRQANRPKFIIEDVRSRKGCICTGSGLVHKSKFAVRSFAL